MTKFVDYDPYTGITETFEKDGDKIHIKQSMDLQPFIDSNHQGRRDNKGWQGEWHKVASIPPLVIEMWNQELKEHGHTDCNCLSKENKVWFMAKLNNSDFIKLRTKEGKV